MLYYYFLASLLKKMTFSIHSFSYVVSLVSFFSQGLVFCFHNVLFAAKICLLLSHVLQIFTYPVPSLEKRIGCVRLSIANIKPCQIYTTSVINVLCDATLDGLTN